MLINSEVSKRQKLESELEAANAAKKRMEKELKETIQQKAGH